jgi:hypothetical protein
VHVQVQTLGEQDREEQPALALEQPALEAGLTLRVLLEEHDVVLVDVGILADRVRVGVVAGVL